MSSAGASNVAVAMANSQLQIQAALKHCAYGAFCEAMVLVERLRHDPWRRRRSHNDSPDLSGYTGYRESNTWSIQSLAGKEPRSFSICSFGYLKIQGLDK